MQISRRLSPEVSDSSFLFANCGLGPFKGSRASRSRGRGVGRNAGEMINNHWCANSLGEIELTLRRASRRFFLVWVLT